MRSLLQGASAPTTVAAKLSGVTSLALGGGAVFEHVRAPVCGSRSLSDVAAVFELGPTDSAPRMLAMGLEATSDLVFRGNTLYFITFTSGSSSGAAKPVAISPQ